MDQYDTGIRERIFYIFNDYDQPQLCPYCKVNKLNFLNNVICLSKICKSKECKGKIVGINNSKTWNNRSAAEKSIIAERRAISNRGKKRSPEIIARMRLLSLGRKGTPESKKRRFETRKNNGKPWHTETAKCKIRNSNKITHNSLDYRIKNKITELTRAKLSNTMKLKIAEGTFTPCITNSWTRWKAFANINGIQIKFRSTWEAAFWILNQHLQYEKVRIPYVLDGVSKNYIVDFVDYDNRILYEIKPELEIETVKNKSKMAAAKSWCSLHGYTMKIVSNNWFQQNAHLIDYECQPQLIKGMGQFL